MVVLAELIIKWRSKLIMIKKIRIKTPNLKWLRELALAKDLILPNQAEGYQVEIRYCIKI